MPLDVRINNVQTDIQAVDSSALMTPAMRDELVRLVLQALEARQNETRRREADTQLGTTRHQNEVS